MHQLMTPQEVADELRISLASLYGLNYKRTGPLRIKVGRHVRYRRSDVEAWLDANACGPGVAR